MVLGGNVERDSALKRLVLDTSVNKCHSVYELATDVRKIDKSHSFVKVCNVIRELEMEGKLILVQPPSPILRFHFERQLQPLPLLRTVGAVMGILAVLFFPAIMPYLIPKAILALFFLLFSPGFSVVELLFTAKRLDIIELLALSVGLSVVIAGVAAIIVSFSLGHLETLLVIISLSILSLGCSIAQSYRARAASAAIIGRY